MNESGGRSAGRVVTAVILAIIAIVFIVFAIITVSEPAKSVPGFVPDGHIAGSNGIRPLHVAGWFVLAVIFFVAAWFALRFTPKASAAADSPENTPAGQR